MIGNTLTLPFATPVVLTKKWDDKAYSSEYSLFTELVTYKARVRHSVVKATPTKPAYDRHNFEVVVTTLATETVPEFDTKFYFVFEHKPGALGVTLPDAVADLIIATSNAFMNQLVQWEI